MWTRTIAFVTYLITVISVKGWFSPSSHRRMLHSGGSGSRSAIISSRDDAAPIIAIEDTWPQLAGKQTSATAAAGKSLSKSLEPSSSIISSQSELFERVKRREALEYRPFRSTSGIYCDSSLLPGVRRRLFPYREERFKTAESCCHMGQVKCDEFLMSVLFCDHTQKIGPMRRRRASGRKLATTNESAG